MAKKIGKLGAEAVLPLRTPKLEYDKEIKELMREQAVRNSVPKLELKQILEGQQDEVIVHDVADHPDAIPAVEGLTV